MNEQEFNNQKITEYLLGSLPESEAERFDELSFTDDDFAAALASAENDLVDAYVRDELAGASLAKFKSHYLASPLRREKVGFARSFQIYAEQNRSPATENLAAAESKPKRAAGFFSSLNIFKNQNSIWQWSFVAAALVLTTLVGFWIINNRLSRQNIETAKQTAPTNHESELPKQIEKQQPESSNSEREIIAANPENKLSPPKSEKESANKPSNAQTAQTPEKEKTATLPKPIVASFVLAPPLRGGQITNLPIPKKTTDVNINLELESDDYSAYRVALVDESGGVNLWRSRTIKATGKGEGKRLTVRFPAKLLKSRIYSLRVSGISSDGASEIISDYPFKVVR
ncbi:MAG: hypothetical protein ACR2HG_11235 [Pyrinomonadaceae bacterium]